MEGLLGNKLGMSQVFDKDGNVIPVTVIAAGPCYVTQVKTADTDRYTAIQLGFKKVKEKAGWRRHGIRNSAVDPH